MLYIDSEACFISQNNQGCLFSQKIILFFQNFYVPEVRFLIAKLEKRKNLKIK